MWLVLALVSPSFAVTPDAADSLLNEPGAERALRLNSELGFIAPLAHSIQFGRDGTMIDYLDDGGQDNLFPLVRLSADVDFGDRHSVVLLAQPLDLNTTALMKRDIVVDDATFEKNTGVNFRYGFSFYRGSYLYDLDPADDTELAIGLSLQIRNATIGFESTDGEIVRNNRNIGPVPILKVRGRTPIGDKGWWFGGEADGFYAPVSYLNGDNNDVVGAILDSSLRLGAPLKSGSEAFVNLRYLGGGAKGQSDNATYPSDGWTENWLHLATVSLGLTLK